MPKRGSPRRQARPILSVPSSSSSSCSFQDDPQGQAPMLDQMLEKTRPVVMDDRIWRLLPEDLVDRVLARLPLHSLFRLRSVNKRFNSIIYSESFVILHAETYVGMKPWFLMTTLGNMACTYNPALDKWHNVPLPPIAPMMHVVAAGGSLLCFGDQIGECTVLSVCNPLVKSVRDLPPMLQIRLIHKVAMVTDPASKSYKIMVAGEDGIPPENPYVYNLSTEVYDSSTMRWTVTGSPLPEAKFGSDPGVWCNGLFYCITELPYGVVVYDPERRVWIEVRALMPASLASPSLVHCRGRLLMVGRVLGVPRTLPKTESIRIWELELATMEWIEVHKLPGLGTSKVQQSGCIPFKGSARIGRGPSSDDDLSMYQLQTRLQVSS